MKMGRRHNLVSYDKNNYVELKVDKPMRENYERILKVRLPCLPRYFYGHENEYNYFLLRLYYPVRFNQAFAQAKIFDQMLLLYSIIGIVEELHQRGILIGRALTEACFVDEKRVLLEPEQTSSKEEDIHRLKQLVAECGKVLKSHETKLEFEDVLAECSDDPFALI